MKNILIIFSISLFILCAFFDATAQKGKKIEPLEDTIVRTKKNKFKFEEVEGLYTEGGGEGYTGYYIHFRNNGTLKARGHLKDGIKDGVWKYCYSNGKAKALESFKEGNAHGLWIEFDKSGDPSQQKKFKDGKLLKAKDWNESEADTLVAQYNNDELTPKDYRRFARRRTGGAKQKAKPKTNKPESEIEDDEQEKVTEPANSSAPADKDAEEAEKAKAEAEKAKKDAEKAEQEAQEAKEKAIKAEKEAAEADEAAEKAAKEAEEEEEEKPKRRKKREKDSDPE